MADKFEPEHLTLEVNEDKHSSKLLSHGNKSEKIDVYEELYDNHDKYFDYVHELYNNIHEYRQELASEILAHDHFPDFFAFCVGHMNKYEIDQDNKKIINDKWTKSLNKTPSKLLSVTIPDLTLVPVTKSKKHHKKNKSQ